MTLLKNTTVQLVQNETLEQRKNALQKELEKLLCNKSQEDFPHVYFFLLSTMQKPMPALVDNQATLRKQTIREDLLASAESITTSELIGIVRAKHPDKSRVEVQSVLLRLLDEGTLLLSKDREVTRK